MIIASFLQYFIIAHVAHSCSMHTHGRAQAVESAIVSNLYVSFFLLIAQSAESCLLFKQMLSVQFNESRERIDLNYGLFEYAIYCIRAPEIH